MRRNTSRIKSPLWVDVNILHLILIQLKSDFRSNHEYCININFALEFEAMKSKNISSEFWNK